MHFLWACKAIEGTAILDLNNCKRQLCTYRNDCVPTNFISVHPSISWIFRTSLVLRSSWVDHQPYIAHGKGVNKRECRVILRFAVCVNEEHRCEWFNHLYILIVACGPFLFASKAGCQNFMLCAYFTGVVKPIRILKNTSNILYMCIYYLGPPWVFFCSCLTPVCLRECQNKP